MCSKFNPASAESQLKKLIQMNFKMSFQEAIQNVKSSLENCNVWVLDFLVLEEIVKYKKRYNIIELL